MRGWLGARVQAQVRMRMGCSWAGDSSSVAGWDAWTRGVGTSAPIWRAEPQLWSVQPREQASSSKPAAAADAPRGALEALTASAVRSVPEGRAVWRRAWEDCGRAQLQLRRSGC